MDCSLIADQERKVIMSKVVMYTTGICPFCIMAKRIFDDLDVAYEEIRVDKHPEKRQEMMKITNRRTVPQVFIGDRHVGGCDDTQDALRSGQLKVWLKEAGIHV
jgi:glutaredoxin 3